MRITRICIKNFRSIEDVTIETNNLNVLVGQNNHGKTNFLTAINWFFYGGSTELHKRKGTGSGNPYIEICFDDVQGALKKMKNEKNSKTLSSKLENVEEVSLVRTVDEEGKTNRRIVNRETRELSDPGTGFDKALNDFLPNLEFVQTENNLRDILKYGKTTQIGTMLSGVLNEILASGDPAYKRFVDEFYTLFGSKESKIYDELRKLAESVELYLKKQFPETTKVEFEVKNPELTDLFKNFSAKVDDGVVTEAYEKGDGMQRALMLAIIQTFADYRRKNADIKNFIFLIDEGELHLHPGAQRHLKSALEDLAKDGDQIFLTTHSSVLISDDSSGDKQSTFKVEKFEDGVTNIDIQNEYAKKNIIYELLGGSPTDLLMPSNFIIVEGSSEVDFLSKVIERHYPEKKSLKILPARGDFYQSVQLMNSLEKLFTPLSESIYKGHFQVLIDKSKLTDAQFQELLTKVPNFDKDSQFHELSLGSLEEYYPIKKADQCADSSNSRLFMEKWKLSSAEVSALSSKQKSRMSKIIGDNITKDQFENEMPLMLKVLNMAYEKKL
ncbi:MAG: hypothetical protein JWO47_583 [Candidatus Saccharibacteria bacterium]|nr:hypothetical protein [Candidatus Saccharibacteria bacterium]